MTRSGWMLLAVLAAGCAGVPEGSGSDSPSAAGDPAPRLASLGDTPPESAYELKLRQRALTQGRQGRLADAAVTWEVLTVLRPASTAYREHLRETRRLIDSALADAMSRAQQAHRRGELDTAAAQYLAALSLKPDHAAAADALRAIERERIRRPGGASRAMRAKASSPFP